MAQSSTFTCPPFFVSILVSRDVVNWTAEVEHCCDNNKPLARLIEEKEDSIRQRPSSKPKLLYHTINLKLILTITVAGRVVVLNIMTNALS